MVSDFGMTIVLLQYDLFGRRKALHAVVMSWLNYSAYCINGWGIRHLTDHPQSDDIHIDMLMQK